MASAGDVIQTIIQLGTLVKGAAAKSGGTGDWTTVLGTILHDGSLSKAVSDLFNQLKGQAALDTALSGVKEKETALLKKANVPDASGLSGKDLLAYHSLADAELVLATQKVVNALDASFLDWVVDDALPALTTVLPIIIAAI
jgi:hypothetical protein